MPSKTTPAKAGLNRGPELTRGGWIAKAILVVVLVLVLTLGDVRGWIGATLRLIQGLGVWGVALYIVIYAVATVFLIPGSALTLGAGALFGVVRGSIYVSVAATLGATAAFLVGRYLARSWVARKMEWHPTLAAIDRAVAEEGWKIVLLTRLSPAFPFTLLNYAFGLTRVPLGQYVLASWIGMTPGILLYVYLGSVATAGVTSQRHTPAERALYLLGLIATVTVTIVITRMARRALRKRTEPQHE